MRCGFKLTIYEVTSMPSDLGPYKLHSSAKYFIRADGRGRPSRLRPVRKVMASLVNVCPFARPFHTSQRLRRAKILPGAHIRVARCFSINAERNTATNRPFFTGTPSPDLRGVFHSATKINMRFSTLLIVLPCSSNLLNRTQIIMYAPV